MKKEYKKISDATKIKFAEEYLKDKNKSAAAVRAGFNKCSAHVAANRLLKDDIVKKIIKQDDEKTQQSVQEAIKRCKVTAEYVISTIMEVIEMSKGTKLLTDTNGRLVKMRDEEGNECNLVCKYDAQAILKGTEQLSKILGLYAENRTEQQGLTILIKK